MNFDFTFWLILALTVSAAANFFMLWYIRRLLSKFLFISENLNDLVTIVQNYEEHLKSVYTLEQYYKDETIDFLISHTRSLLDVLQEYEDIYTITTPLLDDNDDDDEADLEGEEEDATPQKYEENVFYAGSRKRDS